MRRLLHLMRKELLELKADPRLFGIVIIAPILQLGILGYAATTDVKDVPVVIVDADRTNESRELIARFEASSNFVIAGIVGSTNEIDPWLERGDAWLALSIPADYATSVRNGRPVQLQVVADGSDSNSTNVALSYARALVAGYGQELMSERALSEPGGRRVEGLINAEIRVWFNPELESRVFMIPGIFALLLLVVTTNLSAMAIVREREVGTLEHSTSRR
jgi:ABC-2 type transport system permease protein